MISSLFSKAVSALQTKAVQLFMRKRMTTTTVTYYKDSEKSEIAGTEQFVARRMDNGIYYIEKISTSPTEGTKVTESHEVPWAQTKAFMVNLDKQIRHDAKRYSSQPYVFAQDKDYIGKKASVPSVRNDRM